MSLLAPQKVFLCYPGLGKLVLGTSDPATIQLADDLNAQLIQYITPPPEVTSIIYSEALSIFLSSESQDIAPFFLWVLTRDSIANPQSLSELRSCARAISENKTSLRVSSVIEENLNLRLLPPEMLSIKNYTLFSADNGSHASERESEKTYWQCVDDIANDIAHTLKTENVLSGAQTPKTIFLAPVIADLESYARNIRRDLEHRGAIVLSVNPTQDENFQNSIKAQLKNSLASIHLLEKASFDSSHDRQSGDLESLSIALEYAKSNPEFQILTWTPLQHEDDRTEQLILQLIRKHQELSSNTEVVQNALEDFKSLIMERLGNVSRLRHHTIEKGKHKEVYVIYDRQDEEATKAVTEYLGTFGIDVLQTSFTGEQTKLRETHNEFLRRCDAALIIYGRVREPWVRMKQQDLLRAAALGRSNQITAKAVYLCPQITDDKRRFSAPDMMIINGEASTAGLEPFLKSLIAA